MKGRQLEVVSVDRECRGGQVDEGVDSTRESTLAPPLSANDLRVTRAETRIGRTRERGMLDRLLRDIRTGQSVAVVLRGDAGIGKTALLAHARDAASDFRVLRTDGVEAEMDFALAGAQRLCAPLMHGVARLPQPQRQALETAFGLSAGPPPDRFFVGLAVLALLSETASGQPILCLVDDAQWLDRVSAEVLAFAARRLHAESVGLLFATRNLSEPDVFTGLPQLAIGGLEDTEARELLHSVIPGPLDAGVEDRVIAEAQGNPLALVEVAYPLTPERLAGVFAPGALAPSGRIEATSRHRIHRLPPEAQLLLLLAAAEPAGDPALLWRAAAALGLTSDAATPAEADGLLRIGALVTFRHPQVRSTVYAAASLADRRRVHAALAAATDPELDPARRAWHRALAATESDEVVASDLERSADRAQARGGLAAASAFLEHAARLTPDPARRGKRALAAAQAKLQAAAPDAALGLVGTAEAGPLDDLGCARARLLRAQIAFATSRGRATPGLLLRAARQLEPLDASLARETYLEALSAASFLGHLSRGIGVFEVAQAALAAPPAPQPARAVDLLLDGLALMFTDGYLVAGPVLQRALRAFGREAVTVGPDLRWLWLACRVALNLWDYDTLDALSERYVHLTREAGALSEVPGALRTRAVSHMFGGDLAAVASMVEEAGAIASATGSRFPPYGALGLAAFCGHEADFSSVVESVADEMLQRGEGMSLSVVEYTKAVLNNGLRRYDDALAAAEHVAEHQEDVVMGALPELIEASVRSGKLRHASEALERLSVTTRAGGTDWGLGIEAECHALLTEGAGAEELYREAIERLRRTRVPTALARAQLLYGEWLRRERRRHDAREQLRAAHGMFAAMGMEAFAARSAGELLATGEAARTRTVETQRTLTPQEDQIARLARGGLSNPEIGARLFISRRTVEYHLHKVFTKLDIGSRNELAAVLERERA